jgi:hypothetical protein
VTKIPSVENLRLMAKVFRASRRGETGEATYFNQVAALAIDKMADDFERMATPGAEVSSVSGDPTPTSRESEVAP